MTSSTSSLLVFDLDCRGAEHELFNAACIEALSIANPDSTLTFFAQAAHVQHVLPLLPPLQERFMSQALPAPNGQELWRSNPLLIAKHILALVQARPHQVAPLKAMVFLSCGVRTFLAIQLATLWLRDLPTLVVFHGALEKLESGPEAVSLGDHLFRGLFRHKLSRHLNYCVLGPSLQRHLATLLPKVASECVVIDLPYLFTAPHRPTAHEDTVVFGHIGYAHALKGSEDFMSIASRIKASSRLGGRAGFVMAGGMDPNNPLLHGNQAVTYAPASWPIPRDLYDTLLATLHYAVFTYPPDSYRLRASGAVFDAIGFCIPIICLRTPYFEYIFEAAGDVGYLCEDIEEVHTLCQRLIEHFPAERHAQQRQNLRKAQERFTPPNIAAQLRERYFANLDKEGSPA